MTETTPYEQKLRAEIDDKSLTLRWHAFRSNERAAEIAVAAVADWLRELAEDELSVPERTHAAGLRRAERARALTDAADSLTPTQETP